MAGKGLGFVALVSTAAAPPALIASQIGDFTGSHALNLGGAAANFIAAIAPAIVADAALVGVATPVAAAAALAFLAPPRESRVIFALALLVCVVAWVTYAWLNVTLDKEGQQKLANILDDGSDKNVAYVVNFSTAGRLAFLALAATLVGVKLRAAGAAAALAIVVLAFPGQALAGSVKIAAEGPGFTVTAAVLASSGGAAEPLTAKSGVFEFAFDETSFGESAYAERVFLIVWSPIPSVTIAPGAQTFSVEIPVLLRKWRANDIYRIDASPMTGTGQKALTTYEQMLNPSMRWTRFLASLQQAVHLAREVSPDFARTKRAYNTAVDALTAIGAAGWTGPPSDLRERIRQSFESSDPSKFRSLAQALDNIESNVWKDIRTIVTDLRGQPCAVVDKTFGYLSERRAANQTAYDLQLRAEPDALESRRALAMTACAGVSAAAAPVAPAQ